MAEELKPYFEKARPSCPFYGFSGMFGSFIDTRGNQCGLVSSAHSPCLMELDGLKPSFYECRLNTEESRKNFESQKERLKVYPQEFTPPGQSWDGISLDSWIKYITKDAS